MSWLAWNRRTATDAKFAPKAAQQKRQISRMISRSRLGSSRPGLYLALVIDSCSKLSKHMKSSAVNHVIPLHRARVQLLQRTSCRASLGVTCEGDAVGDDSNAVLVAVPLPGHRGAVRGHPEDAVSKRSLPARACGLAAGCSNAGRMLRRPASLHTS